MTTYLLSGVVSGPSGFLNGASVTAYDESLFTNAPAAGDAPPAAAVLGTNAFNTDANGQVVLSGTEYGGNGQWQIQVGSNHGYYIGVLYPVGSTTAQYYWSYDDSLIQSRGLQGYQGSQGNDGTQGSQGNIGDPGIYESNDGVPPMDTNILWLDETATASPPNATELQGYPVSATAPTEGQVLVFTSGVWTPTTL